MYYANAFFNQYVATALWSSNDESNPETGGEPMDRNYSIDDIDPTTLVTMRAQCDEFIAGLRPLLRAAIDMDSETAEQAGHDFWLTRNGHGAGYWDGDWKKRTGQALTEASEKAGERNLYIGDDNKIYCLQG